MSPLGRGKRPSRPRTEEERLRALEERQRRREAAAQRRRATGAPPAAAGEEPPRPPREPAPSAWPPPLGPISPSPPRHPVEPSPGGGEDQPAAPLPPEAEPATEPARPRRIEPDPPAQPPAGAFELPDHRQIAVHRRRPFGGGGPRTIVSPPGDAVHGRTRRNPRARRILTAIAGVLLLLVVVSQWLLWQPLKGDGGAEVTVRIPEGEGAGGVAQRLADAGVVDSATLFGLRALLAGKRDALTAGTLTLREDMSYGAALDALTGATPATPDLQRVTIPEGLSIAEIGDRFRRQNVVKGYEKAAQAALSENRSRLRRELRMPQATKTLEGLLFPSTYELVSGFRAADVVDLQLEAMLQQLDGVSMTKARRAGLSPYEVLIVASMVEREARLTRERPLIAAVIYNRLEAKMPLGIDATFRYASGNWTDPIRQSELERDGPYNSRTRTGLPPTPIGNPGLDSIKAAASPADVDYLYFVVKPGRCGEHAFSSTQEKFLADQAKYNQAREAAGGSPQTC